MIDPRTFLTLVLSIFSIGAMAQTTTAEAYFNQASREFVKMDKMTALRTLDQGLQQYPGDPKLLKLAEELVKEEQRKQQEEQQKKEQQQQEKDKNNEKEKGDGKGEQQKEDQADRPEDGKQDQAGESGKEQQDEPGKDQAGNEQQSGDQQQKPERPMAGRIAPQDAMRMLEALELSEKEVQNKVRAKRRPASRRTIEKDW